MSRLGIALFLLGFAALRVTPLPIVVTPAALAPASLAAAAAGGALSASTAHRLPNGQHVPTVATSVAVLPPNGMMRGAKYVPPESPLFDESARSEAIVIFNGGVVSLTLFGSPYARTCLEDAIARYPLWRWLRDGYILHLAANMAPNIDGEFEYSFVCGNGGYKTNICRLHSHLWKKRRNVKDRRRSVFFAFYSL